MTGWNETLRALVWLARWYGSRRESIERRRQEMEYTVIKRLAEEADFPRSGDYQFTLNGFKVTLRVRDGTIGITDIEPPTLLQGSQLWLFGVDEYEA